MTSFADGFQLAAWRETLKTKPFPIDAAVPLEHTEACPACMAALKPLLSLTGADGAVVRKGACPSCGTMTFMDRPARDWLVDYYSNVWDEASTGGTAQDLAHFVDLRPSRTSAVALVDSAGLPSGASVFEIGVGYGGVLKHLSDKGYSVMGLENSAHRARQVREHYGWPIWHGEWGSEEVTGTILQAQGVVDCFITHHVLEHVDSPDRFVSAMATLQKPGGRIVVAVPNIVGEHSCLAAFYLPHLHNFTKEGLERLLNRHGYQVEADASPDDTNIIIRAVRTENPSASLLLHNDYLERNLTKLRRGLALASVPTADSAKLYWEDGWGELDMARIESVGQRASMERMTWLLKSFLRRLKKATLAIVPSARGLKRIRVVSVATQTAVPSRGYTMIVRPLQTRRTETPLEVQFPGPLTFLMK